MLATLEHRWTLETIKEHSFFTTHLPNGALELSDRVTAAASDSEAESESSRVFSSLQSILSCCGPEGDLAAQIQEHHAPAPAPPECRRPCHPPLDFTLGTACQPQFKQPPLPTAPAPPSPHRQREPIRISVNSEAFPSDVPVVRASGYTTVCCRQLSPQLNSQPQRGEEIVQVKVERADGENVRCGAGPFREVVEVKPRQHQRSEC
jgi:hypothetical protein